MWSSLFVAVIVEPLQVITLRELFTMVVLSTSEATQLWTVLYKFVYYIIIIISAPTVPSTVTIDDLALIFNYIYTHFTYKIRTTDIALS